MTMTDKTGGAQATSTPHPLPETGHTKTPWEVDPRVPVVIKTVPDADRSWRFIGEMTTQGAEVSAEEIANAAFIVLSCNSHERLTTALENLLERLDDERLAVHLDFHDRQAVMDARSALTPTGNPS